MGILETSVNWDEVSLVPLGAEKFEAPEIKSTWEDFSGDKDFGDFSLQPLEQV